MEYLIGSLDDDGLLRKSLESICDELAIYAGIESTEEELEEALCILQDFDPAGIGARNLQECLMIQILRKKSEEKKPSPILNLEERIISDCYEEFTRKHWEKIIKKLDVREETFNEAIAEITKLIPVRVLRSEKPSEETYSRLFPIFWWIPTMTERLT